MKRMLVLLVVLFLLLACLPLSAYWVIDGGWSRSASRTTPDVCRTPTVSTPVPIPYPNFSEPTGGTKVSKRR